MKHGIWNTFTSIQIKSTINELHAHNHRFPRFFHPNVIYIATPANEEEILSPYDPLRSSCFVINFF